MKVLAVDIGGTHVKILATGQKERREFTSGPKMTPQLMVAGVKKLAGDWQYDVIAMGYPGPVRKHRPAAEPHNLAKGWVKFNFAAAFKCPVKMVNDAAMQALGGYRGGIILFLGLGTGLGSALIVEGAVAPLELAHLPYKKATYEDYVGIRGLEKHGKKKWRKHVAEVVKLFIAAFEPDDVVLGGGNAKLLKKLPKGCREGDNTNAFLGGFRLWENAAAQKTIPSRTKTRPSPAKKIKLAAPAKSKPSLKPVAPVAPVKKPLKPRASQPMIQSKPAPAPVPIATKAVEMNANTRSNAPQEN